MELPPNAGRVEDAPSILRTRPNTRSAAWPVRSRSASVMEAQFAQIAALGTQGLLAQKDAIQAQVRANGGPVPKLAAHQKLREDSSEIER